MIAHQLLDTLRILTIDDQAALRRSIRGYLEDYDYEVAEAADGLEGIEQVETFDPDAVLVDLRMPGMDGLGFVEYMKVHHPKIPLVIVSGAGDMSMANEAMRAGAWDYISKPIIDLSVLERTLKRVIGRARKK